MLEYERFETRLAESINSHRRGGVMHECNDRRWCRSGGRSGGSQANSGARSALLFYGVSIAVLVVWAFALLSAATAKGADDKGTDAKGADKPSPSAERLALVQVGDCSGVCIDPAGIVLTAKHCRTPARARVRFHDRTVEALRLFVAPQPEGPVVYDCLGDGYPWRPFARNAPLPGGAVHSHGLRLGSRDLNYQYYEGRVLACGPIGIGGTQSVMTDYRVVGGNSGGPLFNADGDVIGLCSTTDLRSHRSTWIGWWMIRDALLSVERNANWQPRSQGRKRILYVLSLRGCGPCQQVAADREAIAAEAGVHVRIVHQGDPEFEPVARAAERATGERLTHAPTFWLQGSSRLQRSYTGRPRLIGFVREALRLPLSAWEDITGDYSSGGLSPDGPDVGHPEIGGWDRRGGSNSNSDSGNGGPGDGPSVEELESLKDDLSDLRKQLGVLSDGDAGPLKKLKAAKAAKDDVAAIKAKAGELREGAGSGGVSWWWGLFAAIGGLLKRRFVDEGGV